MQFGGQKLEEDRKKELTEAIEKVNKNRDYWKIQPNFSSDFILETIKNIKEGKFISLTLLERSKFPINSIKKFIEDIDRELQRIGRPPTGIKFIDNFAYYGINDKQAIEEYNKALREDLDIFFYAAGVKDGKTRANLVDLCASKGEIPQELLYMVGQSLKYNFRIYFDAKYDRDGNLVKVTFLGEQREQQKAIAGVSPSQNAFNQSWNLDKESKQKLDNFISTILKENPQTIILNYSCEQNVINAILDYFSEKLRKEGFFVDMEKSGQSYIITLLKNKGKTSSEVIIKIEQNNDQLIITKEQKIPSTAIPIKVEDLKDSQQQKPKEQEFNQAPKIEKKTKNKEEEKSKQQPPKKQEEKKPPKVEEEKNKQPSKRTEEKKIEQQIQKQEQKQNIQPIQPPKTELKEQQQTKEKTTQNTYSNSITIRIGEKDISVPVLNYENLNKEGLKKIFENLSKGEKVALAYEQMGEIQDILNNLNLKLYYIKNPNTSNYEYVIFEKGD